MGSHSERTSNYNLQYTQNGENINGLSIRYTQKIVPGKLERKWTFTKVAFLNLLCRNYEPRHDKTNKMTVRPAKTQISLGIRPVWSETSLSAWRNIGPLATHWAHSQDSDQTGRMLRLIWVFAGRTLTLSVCHAVTHIHCKCSNVYSTIHNILWYDKVYFINWLLVA